MSMYVNIELIPNHTNPQQYLDNYNNEEREPYSPEFVTAYPLYTIWSFSRNTVLGSYLIDHCSTDPSLLSRKTVAAAKEYLVEEQRDIYKKMSELHNHMGYATNTDTFYDIREELDNLRSYLEEVVAAEVIIYTIEDAMYSNDFAISWG